MCRVSFAKLLLSGPALSKTKGQLPLCKLSTNYILAFNSCEYAYGFAQTGFKAVPFNSYLLYLNNIIVRFDCPSGKQMHIPTVFLPC